MPYQRFNSSKRKSTYTGPTRAAVNRSSMRGWVDVHSPYDPTYVKELKDSIQASHRKWDPGQSVWHVNELFLDILVRLLKKHFDEVTTDLLNDENSVVPDNMFVPVFEALRQLPNGSMDKIYKSLANALHPDHGGNTELMVKLNNAYDDVRQ